MDWLHSLLMGLLIGLMVAVPVGPIAILCIRRTIERGFLKGVATGMGAAAADFLYAIAVAFGVSAVSGFIEAHKTWLQLLGGVVVIAVAWHTWHAKALPPDLTKMRVTASSLGGAFLSAFFLTAWNPMTALGFFGIFTAFKLPQPMTALVAGTLSLGVLLGSGVWWLVLTFLVTTVRRWFTQRLLQTINRVAAIALVAFGGYFLYEAFKEGLPWA